jgi:predicted alpha/beta superfamily hydrolase
MNKTFIIILILLTGQCYAQTQQVNIPNSEIRKITSAIVIGQEYELQIMLPAGYNTGNKKYPVLYLMDSQWDFPLVTALYGQQYFDGFIPPMIIVGVTWGGIHPNADSLRARDYTPINEKRTRQSGGADRFLSFMKNELFPFIETNYNADKNDRTLMGCSLGGLFTLYTLFTQPGSFQRYVAASPAIGWDNEVIYQYEKKYLENRSNPSAKLFMCIGGVERNVPGYEKFYKFLANRSYPSLDIQSKILENIGHSGTKGEGYEKGMQFVFERPSIRLSPTQLQKYTGSYKTINGNTIDIKIEKNLPVVYFGIANKYVLISANENDFYSTAEFLNIHFQRDNEGSISGFQLERYGGSENVVRVK